MMTANEYEIPERVGKADNYLDAKYNLDGQQQWYDQKSHDE
jgi:hypothetical protein